MLCRDSFGNHRLNLAVAVRKQSGKFVLSKNVNFVNYPVLCKIQFVYYYRNE